MTSSEPANSLPTVGETTPQPTSDAAVPPSQPDAAAFDGVTREQADQILQELKSIKQNIFWLLLVAGFFAARSFFFHY